MSEGEAEPPEGTVSVAGEPAAGHRGQQRRSLVHLVVFDVAGPLAVYYGLRSSGTSTVVSLVVSGLVPAIGIVLEVRRHRRIDPIGVVVLLGILTGTVVGLVSGSARLVLLDGVVPTAVLAAVCFGSLLTARPLMFRTALQFIGPDTQAGRHFESHWQWAMFRRAFVIITVVWGTVFLAETVAQVSVVELASINTAKATANIMPLAVAALTAAWTFAYGKRLRARGEREAEAAERAHAAAASPEPPSDSS